MSGFIWISNRDLERIRVLPKKWQSSARVVLLSYAWLSSCNSNAKTFSAPIKEVARLANCSIKRAQEATRQLVDIGIIKVDGDFVTMEELTNHH